MTISGKVVDEQLLLGAIAILPGQQLRFARADAGEAQWFNFRAVRCDLRGDGANLVLAPAVLMRVDQLATRANSSVDLAGAASRLAVFDSAASSGALTIRSAVGPREGFEAFRMRGRWHVAGPVTLERVFVALSDGGTIRPVTTDASFTLLDETDFLVRGSSTLDLCFVPPAHAFVFNLLGRANLTMDEVNFDLFISLFIYLFICLFVYHLKKIANPNIFNKQP